MFLNSSPFVSPFPASPFQNTNKTVVQEEQPKENRYLNFNAGNDGCMAYRRGFLSNHIRLAGIGDVTDMTKMILDKSFYRDIKTITLQRQATDHHKEFMKFLKSIQPEMGFKLIYEVDDVVFREEIPDYNASKFGFDDDNIRQNCIDMINMVDEVTVTCKFMRDLYIEKTGKKEITAIPNFMPYWWIGHQYDYRKICDNFEKYKRKPRIVYAGSGAHFDMKNKVGQQDDFSHVLKFIIDNRHKYQFVFIGAYPPPLQPYVVAREIEFHPWKSLLEYPTFLASLNAQLFIAPLQDNNFNKAKSDIKFIEAAQLGIPCLCQDLVTYSSAPDFLRFTTAEDLEDKIQKLLKNKAGYYRLVDDLRKVGSTRFLELEPNVGSFMDVLNTEYGSRDRKFLKMWN
jgi:glycosyltransferase involved in cell wall biosynthesis